MPDSWLKILNDANVTDAAKAVVFGAMYHSGQVILLSLSQSSSKMHIFFHGVTDLYVYRTCDRTKRNCGAVH